MTESIPVFVNERHLSVAFGATARDAVTQADPTLGADLDRAGVMLTDGRGLPVDPSAPLAAGAIIRAFRSARRSAAATSDTLSRDLVARLPKAELHVHFDGSLRPETMIELARDAHAPLPAWEPEALRKAMLVDDAANLEEFLQRFDFTIGVLQTAAAIERVAYEMVEDAARDNVRYLEVRYCPRLSTKGGLTMDEVIQAERRGLARGEHDFGVITGIINCSLRHYDPSISIEIARHSVRMQDHGVVAFDLAGAEAGRPPGLHGEAFDIAQAGGLKITVHAGEAAGPESIAEAIDRCHAMRLGHGTNLYRDPSLQARVRAARIPIEVNVTSNRQTHAVETVADHPVRRYFDDGLAVTLCTDGWLMCGVSLTDEYWLAHQALRFTRSEIDRMLLTGFESAFLPEAERARLVGMIAKELVEIR